MKERQSELDYKAYDIAMQILEVAKTAGEVELMMKKIENQFEWAVRRSEIRLDDYPVDRFGKRIMWEG